MRITVTPGCMTPPMVCRESSVTRPETGARRIWRQDLDFGALLGLQKLLG